MKNIKKISNISIAGLLAVGVMALGFFAYREKIQADTILPGYATAHVGLDITVPDARSVPFSVKFTPINGTGNYYFKNRSFSFETPGLNTVEWYIRKIPQGEYNITLYSSNNELTGSPVKVTLVNDQVNETADFEYSLGEPLNTSEEIENYEPAAEESVVYESPAPTSTETASSATATATSQSGNIVTPGELEVF